MLRSLVNPPVDLTDLIRVCSMTRSDKDLPSIAGFFGLCALHFQIAHEAKDAFLTETSFAEQKDERFWYNLDAQMQQRDSAYL